jgi:hypothetical protein
MCGQAYSGPLDFARGRLFDCIRPFASEWADSAR